MVQDDYNAINILVQDFNEYWKYNSNNIYKLRLLGIEKDFSFMLEVGALEEKQKDLFSQIFNMKKRNPQIAEISINLKSLRNILTYLK